MCFVIFYLKLDHRKKQSFADVLQTRCSSKFRKFHRKTPVLESLFNKVAGRPRRTPFFTEYLRWLLLHRSKHAPKIMIKKLFPMFF